MYFIQDKDIKMKITRRQLRNRIRQILAENIQEKTTIVDGIIGGDPQSINSFVELADSLGYIEDLRYDVEPPVSYFPAEQHTWNFDAKPEFGQLLISRYNQRVVDQDSEVMSIEYNAAYLERTGIYSIQINAIGPTE
tara:strand:- start:196 stop:606 length:411 start_codon:yes stop_codon:yes gene_type:complete